MLGVKRHCVVLVAHDESWSDEYEIVKQGLLSTLGDNVIGIHHVGSTAIRGIVAKPILDVAVEIKSVGDLNIAGMEEAGYEWCADRATPGRYLFVKREGDDLSTRHIHCYLKNNDNLQATISFCSYLNRHPEYAKQYSDLKEGLAARYPDDRVAYTDAKAAFIEGIIALARKEEGSQ